MSDKTLSDLLGRSVDQVPESQPPIAELLRRGRATHRRQRLAAVVGGAVASLLVVAGGAASLQGSDHATPPANRPGGVRQSSLPVPPAGMKWVGVGRTVVAVPQGWPVVPGIYCQGPTGPYVTITQWHVTVGCPPMQGPGGGPSREQSSVDVEGNATGGFTARLAGSEGSSDLTQGLLDASRTTLPSGWLTVPSGEPYGGAGTPTLTSQIAALESAGFRVVRERAAQLGRWQPVTTDPEIGTPARRGSTVVVFDHGTVASSATLTGQLLWVGGPAPDSLVAHPGTVHVVNADDSVDQTVRADEDGRWQIYLPPGNYRVRATSPGYLGARGTPDACSPTRTRVTVVDGESISVNVYCPLG